MNPFTIIMLLSNRPVLIFKDDGNDMQAYNVFDWIIYTNIDGDKEKKIGVHDHIFAENNASMH